MVQAEIVALAKQGDPKAIAMIINRITQRHGIRTRVVRQDACLHVLLESTQVPSQQAAVALVKKILLSLNVELLKSVQVHARRTGEKPTAWDQTIELKPTAVKTKSPPTVVVPAVPDIPEVEVAKTSVASTVAPEMIPAEMADTSVEPGSDLSAEIAATSVEPTILLEMPQVEASVIPETTQATQPLSELSDLLAIRDRPIDAAQEASQPIAVDELEMAVELVAVSSPTSGWDNVTDVPDATPTQLAPEPIVTTADDLQPTILPEPLEPIPSTVSDAAESTLLLNPDLLQPVALSEPSERVAELLNQDINQVGELAITPVEVVTGAIVKLDAADLAQDHDDVDLDYALQVWETPQGLDRPEIFALLAFALLVLLWEAYVSLMEEAIPETALSSQRLAQRLGISASSIKRRKKLADFSRWTQSLDPEGIAWAYQHGLFVPLLESDE